MFRYLMGISGAQLNRLGGTGAERNPSTTYDKPTGTTRRLARITATIVHLLLISQPSPAASARVPIPRAAETDAL
jgi:hypothetical protein